MAALVWAPAAGVDGAVRRPERRTGARAGLGFGAKGEGAGEIGRGRKVGVQGVVGVLLVDAGEGGPRQRHGAARPAGLHGASKP